MVDTEFIETFIEIFFNEFKNTYNMYSRYIAWDLILTIKINEIKY